MAFKPGLLDSIRMAPLPQKKLAEQDPMTEFVYKACHIWSKRRPELAEEVLAEDMVEHSWGVRGIAEIQQICYAMHDAFEDYHLDIEDIISEGTLEEGKVCARFSASGKWVNPYCGVEPNNETLIFPGTFTWKVKGGKVTDSWIFQSYASAPDLGYAVLQLSKANGAYC
jgi:predicted ester cyclase